MEYYASKKVVVPGGAGFIGSHLVERLLNLEAEVHVLDNFRTGSRGNLARLNGNGQLQLTEHDITQPARIDADIVINLACPASPVHYQADPIATLKTSVFGINNLLEWCRAFDGRLVHASTSEVYGDPLQHPQREDYWGNVNPLGVRACYDEGKRAAETLAMDYHRIHGCDVRLPRIFNTYGPNMAVNDGRVVSNFITQALAGAPLTVAGDGSQTRSFCFVSDTVEALLRFGALDGLSGEVINLGNPNEISVSELASIVIEMTESSSKIEYIPQAIDDPVRRNPDISKAGLCLDWCPRVSLREGLDATIGYFRALKNSNTQMAEVE